MPQRTLQAKLFFVAATEIRVGRGTSCRYGRSRRNYSPLRRRKLELDANVRCCNRRCRRNPAVIRKFGPEIKNHCSLWPVSWENLASIPKSGPEIKNRCTQKGINRQNPTSILKSGPEIKNRCTKERVNGENLASILKFGLEIKN